MLNGIVKLVFGQKKIASLRSHIRRCFKRFRCEFLLLICSKSSAQRNILWGWSRSNFCCFSIWFGERIQSIHLPVECGNSRRSTTCTTWHVEERSLVVWLAQRFYLFFCHTPGHLSFAYLSSEFANNFNFHEHVATAKAVKPALKGFQCHDNNIN